VTQKIASLVSLSSRPAASHSLVNPKKSSVYLSEQKNYRDFSTLQMTTGETRGSHLYEEFFFIYVCYFVSCCKLE